ncbi:helix-turn-helix transcriptional regulator [Shewanella intestini]|uniref:LuxR family transcriptional regulator n=1 Tax=Shewanella intestini TaxID=2017544 RepID=A0ABS5I3Q9_9GAMM|nr:MULTISPECIES: hypothetical protein [Shewanella]MBR9727940.1 hypothetical protein [Shewanella intestini]MRG36509.1 hypothetical protein [Shewanella sp. XMDDZSB0408]
MKTVLEKELNEIAKKFGAEKCAVFFRLNSDEQPVEVKTSIMTVVVNDRNAEDEMCLEYCNTFKMSAKSLSLSKQNTSKFVFRKSFSSLGTNVLSIDIPLLIAERISVRFIFLSSHSFNQELIEQSDFAQAKLLNCALFLNNKYSLISNMLLDCGMLNPKLLNIISMVANGTSRDDISEIMNLSVRGVDYYIDMAKQIFDAKTMPELVYIASQYGLIHNVSIERVCNEA